VRELVLCKWERIYGLQTFLEEGPIECMPLLMTPFTEITIDLVVSINGPSYHLWKLKGVLRDKHF
jgi:hypothetical protein